MKQVDHREAAMEWSGFGLQKCRPGVIARCSLHAICKLSIFVSPHLMTLYILRLSNAFNEVLVSVIGRIRAFCEPHTVHGPNLDLGVAAEMIISMRWPPSRDSE